MKWISILLFIVLFTCCRKKKPDRIYTVQGQILESSSNPIPVSNYNLFIYQQTYASFLGGISGLQLFIKTASDGKFSFDYNPEMKYGFSLGGTNPNSIEIQGIDTSSYQGLQPTWDPVTPGIDTNLNVLYLYKKIQSLVRKVQFNQTLNPWDTIYVSSDGGWGPGSKRLTGPISAGTILNADTIRNLSLTHYNLRTREYTLSAALRKQSIYHDFSVDLNGGDEIYREILFIY